MYGGRQFSKRSFFIEGDGILLEVIKSDIYRYLGRDATVRPGGHTDPQTGQLMLGYHIKAWRAPTSEMVIDLRRSSARWIERTKNAAPRGFLNPYGYEVSKPGFYPPSASAQSESSSVLRGPRGFNPFSNYMSDDKSTGTAPRQGGYGTGTILPQIGYGVGSGSSTYPLQRSGPKPPVLMRSQSEPIRSEAGNIREIKLIDPVTGQTIIAAALLDTGAVTGNWISNQAVRRLGAERLTTQGGSTKTLQGANGGNVQSIGTIELQFRWFPKGVRINRAKFYVAGASHYDIIFGNEYIDENGLHKWEEDAFTPVTEHDPIISPYESDAMRQAQEKQAKEKEDRAAKKKERR